MPRFYLIILLMVLSLLPLNMVKADYYTPGSIDVLVISPPQENNFLLKEYSIGLRKGFEQDSSNFYSLSWEYMPGNLIGDGELLEEYTQFLKKKYKNQVFDLIITLEDESYKFVGIAGNKIFGNIPIVFCGLKYIQTLEETNLPGANGFVEELDIVNTIKLATDLHPTSRHIYIISDSTALGQHYKLNTWEALKPYLHDHIIKDFTQLTYNQLLDKVSEIKDNSIILYFGFSKSYEGYRFDPHKVLSDIKTITNTPVYTFYKSFLDYGAAGGYVISAQQQGIEAANLSSSILLDRLSPDDTSKFYISTSYPLINEEVINKNQVMIELLPDSIIVYKGDLQLSIKGSQTTVSKSFTIVKLLIIPSLFTFILLIVFFLRSKKYETIANNQQQIFDKSSLGYIHLEKVNGRLIVKGINQKAENLLHCKSEECLNQNIADKIPIISQREIDKKLLKLEINSDAISQLEIVKTGEHVELALGISAYCPYENSIICFIRDLTRNVRDNQRLNAREARLHSVTANKIMGMIVVDPKGDILESNNTFWEMMGASEREMLDTNIMRITHPDEYELTRASLQALSTGEITQSRFETKLIRLIDSKIIWADAFAINLLNKDGSLEAIMLVLADITQKKKSENKLRDSEERHRVLIDMLPEGLLILSGYKDLEALYINKTGASIFGHKNPISFLALPLEKALGNELFSQFTEAATNIYQSNIKTHRQYRELEIELEAEGGIKRQIEYITSQINYEGSKALLCLFRDVTVRKSTENRLKESERQLGLALKGAQIGLWEWNIKSDEHIVDRDFANDKLMMPEMANPKKREHWLDHIHQDDVENVKHSYEKHLNDQLENIEIEYRFKEKFGEWIWIHESGRIVDYDNLKLPSVMAGTIADITYRKVSEAKRKESEELFKNLVESLNDGFVILDENEDIIFANKRLREIFELNSDDYLTLNFEKLLSEGNEEQISDTFSKIRDGEFENFEVNIFNQKLLIILNIAPYPMYDHHSKRNGTFAIVSDITEQKNAEEIIRLSEERLQLALKGADSGMWDWVTETDLVYFDKKWNELTGYESINSKFHTAFLDAIGHPVDVWVLKEALDLHIRGGSEFIDVKHRIRCMDGSYRWINTRGLVVNRNEEGKALRIVGTYRDITEEEENRIIKNRTQVFLRQVIDLMPHAIFAKDQDGVFQLINNEMAELLEKDIKKIKGYNERDIINDQVLRDIVNVDDDLVYKKSEVVDRIFDDVVLEKYLEERTFHLAKVPLQIPGESNTLVLGMIMDVTQLTRAKRQREETEEKYKNFVEASPDGIILSQRGKILFHNQVIPGKLGLPLNTNLAGHTLFDFLSSDFKESEYEQIYQRLLSSDEPIKFEVKIYGPAGKSMDAEILSTMLKIEGEDVTLSFVRDITERKQAEEKLRQSEEQLRSIFSAAAAGLALLDEEGRYVLVNRTYSNMLGYTDEELKELRHRDAVHPMEVEESVRLLDSQFKGNLDTYRTERRLIKKDGNIIYTDFYGSPIRDMDGNVEHVMGIAVDVSDRVRSDSKLKQSEKKFRSIVEQTYDGILLVNQEGIITEWNRALEKITGLPREDTINEYFWDLLTRLKPENFKMKELKEKLQFFLKDLKRNKVHASWLNQQIEVTFTNIAGNPVISQLSPLPIIIESKLLIAIIIRDVTTRREAEKLASIRQEQLVKAEKLVALGTLVSGVAHEINNPNNYISINSTMLIEAFDTVLPIIDEYYDENGDFLVTGIPYSEMRSSLREMLVAIYNGSDRIKKIIDDMKDFARADGKSYDEDVNVHDVINSAKNLLNSLIKHSTKKFELQLKENIPLIKGSYHRLEQVILNVIQNACHSLENREKSIFLSTEYDSKEEQISVIVKDEGKGIDEKDLPRLLDPFFTTKREKGGTGLGLSVSDGIIKDHEGKILINSKIGHGTEVTIKLPVRRKK